MLFSSVFSAMFGSFVKYQFQRTYDAILAAPVDTEELVTAEALWIAARAGVFGCAPLLVAMVFGLDPSWGMLLVPFIGMLTGYGWACFGIIIAAVLNSIDHFSYITSTVVTPMFLTAGTFFPISGLPEWAQVLAQFNPLYHCVELVRGAVFGFDGWVDLYHVGVLVVFAFVTWRPRSTTWRRSSSTENRAVSRRRRRSPREDMRIRALADDRRGPHSSVDRRGRSQVEGRRRVPPARLGGRASPPSTRTPSASRA